MIENIDITHFISELGSKYNRIYYHPNGGNAGDALINVGFYSIARDVGLKYMEIDESFSAFEAGDVVIIAGGGCIVPEWESVPLYIRTVVQGLADIVILSQSTYASDEVLRLLRPTDILILREDYSYKYCKNLELECQLLVADDIAFFSNIHDLNIRNVSFRKILGMKNLIRVFLIIYHLLRSLISKRIFAYRCDSEAKKGVSVSRRIYNDISLVCGFGAYNESSSYTSAYFFRLLLSRYKYVETDRLHVMVMCALNNTEVNVSSNSYHKIQGVYEKSVRDNEKYSDKVKFKL